MSALWNRLVHRAGGAGWLVPVVLGFLAMTAVIVAITAWAAPWSGGYAAFG